MKGRINRNLNEETVEKEYTPIRRFYSWVGFSVIALVVALGFIDFIMYMVEKFT